jgi:hypothetical protein
MRIACIWHDPFERDSVKDTLRTERPDWTVVDICESDLTPSVKCLTLLDEGFDAILLHLSFSHCLAIKMAEIAHRDNKIVRIIAFSRTRADEAAIEYVFDGRIDPDRDLRQYGKIIESSIRRKRITPFDREKFDEMIVKIINTDWVLMNQFHTLFKIKHQKTYSIDDYARLIKASFEKTKTGGKDDSNYGKVFISYSKKDEELAHEIYHMLVDKGVSCYQASMDLKAGSVWEDELREELVAASELLIIVTPNSIASKWIMIEAGAAWVLQKKITPCLLNCNASKLPTPIAKHHSVSIVTSAEREGLVNQISERHVSS